MCPQEPHREPAERHEVRRLQRLIGEFAPQLARGQRPVAEERLDDRHVARLVDGGVLAVVSERRVRGALERTYVLRASAARVGVNEIASMSRDEHRQTFQRPLRQDGAYEVIASCARNRRTSSRSFISLHAPDR